jgi:N-acetylglucosamine-6-phosphate deacetylase
MHMARNSDKANNSTPGILTGRRFPDGQPVRITVREGHIEGVEPVQTLSERGGTQRWITPGLFDLQVNGFAGENFLDPAVTPEDVSHIARSVLRSGATRFLPTVITAGISAMCQQLSVIADTMAADPLVAAMCPGVHIEGPFINPEDGPRGAHPREHVREPSIADFERLHRAAGGRVALLTLAADQPRAVDLIRHARERGVLVAIGHHRAGPEALEAAIDAGARLCTHLGNACDAMLPRTDNYVWQQLGEDRLWASFIADGHHLPPFTLRCMLRAKTVARSVLITDAMAAAGMPPGQYSLGETEVERTPSGRVVLPGTPYQAGSSADMPLVVRNAVAYGGVSFEEAIQMASLQPAALLSCGSWSCAPGAEADLVEFDWNPDQQTLVPHRIAFRSFEVILST